MKITNLTFLFLCLFISQHFYSQIRVKTNGNVSVGSYNPSDNTGTYNFTARNIRSEKIVSIDATIQDELYVYESAGFGARPSYDKTLVIRSHGERNYALHVIGTNQNSEHNPAVYVNGALKASGGVYGADSDIRVKKNIRNINSKNLFAKLSKIRGKKYKFKNKRELRALHNNGVFRFDLDTIYKKEKTVNDKGDTIRRLTKEIKRIKIDVPNYNRGLQYGVLAQDVVNEFPALASTNEKTGVMSVNYNGFIPILIEAVNLQQEKITKLTRKLNRLTKEVDSLKIR